VIDIDVFDVKELSREVRVSQTGSIGLPLVPVRLRVAGLTEIQAEQKIAEVLEANGLVSHPQVSVNVKERRSKPITVVGRLHTRWCIRRTGPSPSSKFWRKPVESPTTPAHRDRHASDANFSFRSFGSALDRPGRSSTGGHAKRIDSGGCSPEHFRRFACAG